MVVNNIGPDRPIQFVASSAEQVDVVASILPARRDAPSDIIDHAKNTDHRGGVNRDIAGLVIERDVAAGNRNAKLQAAIGQSSGRLLELPHDLGVLWATKVEAVGHGHWLSATHRYVSVGLGKSQTSTLVWVELAETAVRIGSNRNTKSGGFANANHAAVVWHC